MQFNQSNNQEPIFHIEVDKIKPNPYQPRKNFEPEALNELASSIREYGVLHPLVVTKIETASPHGTEVEYQLISGERRLMASKLAGLERVPVIIKAAMSDRERLELAIIENIQRENLNPLETGRAYVKLQEQFGLTQREIAVRVGKSRESVANTMRLLNLPSFAQDALSQGQINESQARLLLMVSDMKEQQAIFNDLVLNSLSVRELRNRIKTKKEKVVDNIAFDPSTSMRPKTDPEITSLEEQLMEVLGTKVKVQSEGEGGKLMINFYSKEELQGIIDKLVRQRMNQASHQEKSFYSAPVASIENKSVHQEVITEKVPVYTAQPEIEKLEMPEEHLSLPSEQEIPKFSDLEEEKLLIERIPDPNPDDAPMIIRHDDEYPIPIRRGKQLSDDEFVV
ncbi:MAG: ParB/RepB/Spo0J family partition protein [Minisyncoccota bacterium]